MLHVYGAARHRHAHVMSSVDQAQPRMRCRVSFGHRRGTALHGGASGRRAHAGETARPWTALARRSATRKAPRRDHRRSAPSLRERCSTCASAWTARARPCGAAGRRTRLLRAGCSTWRTGRESPCTEPVEPSRRGGGRRAGGHLDPRSPRRSPLTRSTCWRISTHRRCGMRSSRRAGSMGDRGRRPLRRVAVAFAHFRHMKSTYTLGTRRRGGPLGGAASSPAAATPRSPRLVVRHCCTISARGGAELLLGQDGKLTRRSGRVRSTRTTERILSNRPSYGRSARSPRRRTSASTRTDIIARFPARSSRGPRAGSLQPTPIAPCGSRGRIGCSFRRSGEAGAFRDAASVGQSVQASCGSARSRSGRGRPARRRNAIRLSEREVQVLRLIAAPTSKGVRLELGISAKTCSTTWRTCTTRSASPAGARALVRSGARALGSGVRRRGGILAEPMIPAGSTVEQGSPPL